MSTPTWITLELSDDERRRRIAAAVAAQSEAERLGRKTNIAMRDRDEIERLRGLLREAQVRFHSYGRFGFKHPPSNLMRRIDAALALEARYDKTGEASAQPEVQTDAAAVAPSGKR